MAKIKIDKDLYQRAAEVARVAGYSSVDEFVEHLVERALRESKPDDKSDDEERAAVEERLRGLGYID
jgi:Arc/MetJ family transcription regulator